MRHLVLLPMLASCALAALGSLSTTNCSAEPTVTTFAGTGTAGYDNQGGLATETRINNPFGIVRGPDRALYVCDTDNHVIRRVAPDGTLTTVVGTGERGFAGDGGPAIKALLNEPYEVRFDSNGNMYFVERMNHVVRYVEANTQTIRTLAGTGQPGFSGDGGPASQARFSHPHSLQFDSQGDLFVCDILNHRLRKIDMQTGIVTTVSGTGQKQATPDGAKFAGAPLHGPRAIDIDREGNLWLALREGNALYRLDMKAGTIHHVAGTGQQGFSGHGGPAKLAKLSGPKGVSVGPNGHVYLADTESHSIRKFDPIAGTIHLVAGDGTRGDGPDGAPLACRLARPHGVFVDQDGSVFIGDSENHRVRRLK